jgi:RimJ/RimL family protein N-acetyltransferase
VVETTVPPSGAAALAYMFASAFWGRGFAHEAVSAAIATLGVGGVITFEAIIDTRNAPLKRHHRRRAKPRRGLATRLMRLNHNARSQRF